jgi:hypothetical protein
MPPKWYPKVLPGTVAGWMAPVTSVALARSVYDPGPGVRQRNSHRCQAAGLPGSGGIAGCQRRPPSVLISVRAMGPLPDQDRPVSRCSRFAGSRAFQSSSKALLTGWAVMKAPSGG